MLKVEKNIPIPMRKCGRKPLYPFSEMSVNDSFAVTGTRGKSQVILNAARQWASRYQPGAKFATRKIDENTVRIWRIA